MDRLKRFLPLIVLAGVIALIFGMGWNRYLSLDTIREHGQTFRALTAENYLLALLTLMAVFAILTAQRGAPASSSSPSPPAICSARGWAGSRPPSPPRSAP